MTDSILQLEGSHADGEEYNRTIKQVRRSLLKAFVDVGLDAFRHT
jgi:hypothetical protein